MLQLLYEYARIARTALPTEQEQATFMAIPGDMVVNLVQNGPDYMLKSDYLHCVVAHSWEDMKRRKTVALNSQSAQEAFNKIVGLDLAQTMRKQLLVAVLPGNTGLLHACPNDLLQQSHVSSQCHSQQCTLQPFTWE